MNKLARNSLISIALLMAATPALAQDAAPAAADAPMGGATVASADQRIPPAPADKGQIVFFRPAKGGGMLLNFSVHEGDEGVGKLGYGTYFIYEGAPGQHTFTIQSEAKDSLTLEIDAGETYYVEQTMSMGLVVGRPHLSPTTEAAFTKLKAKSMKLSTKEATDLKKKS